MNIGENIKKYRLFRNFSRKDLAKELQVSESTISRYENNKREPNMETLKKISLILGIPTTEFLADDSINKSVSFEEVKKRVDKSFPTLEPNIQFLSNPKIEMMYNFTYNDLAAYGYEELLFAAIEKAIKNTLQEIKEHEKKGDIFDGVCSWITKESPFYDIMKKTQEKNKKSMNEIIENYNTDE